MTDRRELLKTQVLQVGAWSLCLPALAFWPFLSAMPGFALASATGAYAVGGNLLLLMTGFWPFLAFVILYKIVINRMESGGYAAMKPITGLAVGVYATLWTVAYGMFKFI